MNNEEIISESLRQTLSYYKYLVDNNSGKIRIKINKVEPGEKTGIYNLYLAERIIYTEGIHFQIDGKEYSEEQIRLLSNDKRKKIIKVAIWGQDDPLRNIKTDTSHVGSDLLFLVQRVINWYQKNYCIPFPTAKPVVSEPLHFIDNTDEEQKQIIKSILKEPASYVWGAPGTGKTRVILSQAVAQYIKADKKVIIIAPTNTALDQTMFGLMSVLESEGYDTKLMMRLGTPTPEFAAKYPKNCEVSGIQFSIDELLYDMRMAREELSEYDKLSFNIMLEKELCEALPAKIEKLKALAAKKKEKSKAIQDAEEKKTVLSKSISDINLEIAKAKVRLAQAKEETRSLKYVLSRFFNTNYHKSIKNNLDTALSDQKEKEAVLDNLHSENSLLHKSVSCLNREIKDVSEEQSFILSLSKYKRIKNSGVLEALHSISQSGSESLRLIEKATFLLHTAESAIASSEKRISSLKITSPEILKDTLCKLSDRIKELKEYTVERIIEKAKVLAMTADRFIFKYDDIYRFEPSHAFIDEAGYCNLVKALPVFSLNVPVTLLGDHKQLPPVVTVSNRELDEIPLWQIPAVYCEDVYRLRPDEIFEIPKSLNEPHFENLRLHKLNVTYRFSQSLANVLAKRVYSENFRSGIKIGATRIIVLNTPREKSDKPRENINEAEAVIQYVYNQCPEDYVILTPYKAQIKTIRETAKRHPTDITENGERLMTVHKSQGQEWDTVIFSAVDTTKAFFVRTNLPEGRAVLNTAISRAKHQLVIACDANYWGTKQNEILGDLVRCADEIIIPGERTGKYKHQNITQRS